MRVLLTGAYGFIGLHLAATLRQAGHEVIPAVREPKRWLQRFPQSKVIVCDFSKDIDSSIWESRLQNIDVVINCVGVLQTRKKSSIEAIHYQAPRALFDACVKVGVQRIIQISALGADAQAHSAYTQTKKAAEDYLMSLPCDWVILRPSLVYSTGSSGGTSLFRALAALPGIMPIPGDGKQAFQPIFVEDLAIAVCQLIEQPGRICKRLDAVGVEVITVAMLLKYLRQWLGYPTARNLAIPTYLIQGLAKLGDWLGQGPLNSTSLAMLTYGNTTSSKALQMFIATTKVQPRTMEQVLAEHPAQVQDRWHARLYLLRPILVIAIAFVWLCSGLLPLLISRNLSFKLLAQMGVSTRWAWLVLISSSLWDIILGLLTLWQRRVSWFGSCQLLTMLGYMLICSIKLPHLWLDPLGPLIKNVPLWVATLVMLILAEK